MADDLLHRLKAPTALRQRVVQLIDLHMTKLPAEKKTVRRWLGKLGLEALTQLLLLQKADTASKGICKDEELAHFDLLDALLSEILAEDSCLSLRDLQIGGHELMALGFSGPAIGKALEQLLDLVLEETLPNEKNALLTAARDMTEYLEVHK
jgi:tRNA nucleotidyltransferase (CCA-adding enzyme)